MHELCADFAARRERDVVCECEPDSWRPLPLSRAGDQRRRLVGVLEHRRRNHDPAARHRSGVDGVVGHCPQAGLVGRLTAETGYRIERCTGTGCTTFVSVGQEVSDVVTRSDTGLTPATLYRYRVVAFNAGGDAVPSSIAEKVTLPAAPINLLATSTSPSQINLTWEDGAGESGYQIERCTGAGCSAFAQIAVVGSSVTTFANTSLTSATTYRYRVRSYNASGSSLYSNIGEAVTATAPPPAPGSLVATVASPTEILVRWSDTSAVETGFEIERCQGAGCTALCAAENSRRQRR